MYIPKVKVMRQQFQSAFRLLCSVLGGKCRKKSHFGLLTFFKLYVSRLFKKSWKKRIWVHLTHLISLSCLNLTHKCTFYGSFASWWTKPRRWPRWSSITSWRPQTTPCPLTATSAPATPWKTFSRLKGVSRTKTLSRTSRTAPPVFSVPASAAMSVWPSEHLGPHLPPPPLSWATSWRSSREPYLLRQRRPPESQTFRGLYLDRDVIESVGKKDWCRQFPNSVQESSQKSWTFLSKALIWGFSWVVLGSCKVDEVAHPTLPKPSMHLSLQSH